MSKIFARNASASLLRFRPQQEGPTGVRQFINRHVAELPRRVEIEGLSMAVIALLGLSGDLGTVIDAVRV